MKKFIFLAAVAALAFVGCNKENQGEPATPEASVVYTGASVVEIKEGTNFYTVNFKANKAWEARVEADILSTGKQSVTIDKAKGTTGEQSVKITFEDLEKGQAGRTALFCVSTSGFDKQPAEGEYFIVSFIQGKVFVIGAINDKQKVGAEGGKIEYAVLTNCDWTKIDVKKYDQFEAWAPATFNADKTVLTFTVAANTGYDAREAYVKFTVNEITVGEEVLVARAYAKQEGFAKLAWAKSISANSTKLPVGSLARLCYNTEAKQIAVCSADANVMFGMADGTFGGDATVTSDPAVTSWTTDAAGHSVMATTALYGTASDTLRVVAMGSDILGYYKEIITYKHNSVWSTKLANVRVYGDVTKDAVVCAMTDLSQYCVYWEIKNGVVSDAAFYALPAGTTIWNAERNGCVVPLGTTADQGFLYMAYDGNYKLYVVDKTGQGQSIFSFDDLKGSGAGSNVNFQCISVANFDGDLYALVGVSTYFSWGNCPDMMLFNVTDAKLVSYIDHLSFTLPLTYKGNNDGENAAADVLLVNEGEKLGAYMVDILNDVVYKVEFPKL